MTDEAAAADLIRRFREGDEEAFRLLMERHGSELARRAAKHLPARLHRRVAVSDVLQETCLLAFQRREDLEERGPEAFRRWMLGIVDNKAREAARDHQRVQKRALDREVTRTHRVDTVMFAAHIPSPSKVAMGGEMRDRVRAALAQLPADYREVLRLTREEHLNLKDAAARMERSHEATKKLYGRALCKLKELLDE